MARLETLQAMRQAELNRLEVAQTADLFLRPEHSYTRALLAANPAMAPRGSRLPVIPAEWSVEPLARDMSMRPTHV